jgi:hypothetical protein
VTVTDSFPESSFRTVSGTPSLFVEELQPGASKSATLTLVPKSSGTMTSGRAHVTYSYTLAPDYGAEPQFDADGVPIAPVDDVVEVVSMSTSEGRVEILAPDAYLRKSKTREAGLIAIAVAVAVLTLGPFSYAQNKEKAL